jgi:hypothetical protein
MTFGVNGATSISKMSRDYKVITRGRFKGKKITFASTERIEEFTQLASESRKSTASRWLTSGPRGS